MSSEQPHDVTRLLARITDGDSAATGELLNAAYADLRAMAAVVFGSGQHGHTLQPTALVNEVCMRMLKTPNPGWNDRKHFFRAAARAMRNVLTDYARARNADRRGGGAARVSLDSMNIEGVARAGDTQLELVDLLALDETIGRLAEFDEQIRQVFELRFLAGLTVGQTSAVLEVSERAVEQDSRFIRAWLQRELAS
jgi:RNA polymerase sigma factor (TIGR02999 family)